jgi:hypothetical protein
LLSDLDARVAAAAGPEASWPQGGWQAQQAQWRRQLQQAEPATWTLLVPPSPGALNRGQDPATLLAGLPGVPAAPEPGDEPPPPPPGSGSGALSGVELPAAATGGLWEEQSEELTALAGAAAAACVVAAAGAAACWLRRLRRKPRLRSPISMLPLTDRPLRPKGKTHRVDPKFAS